MNTQWKVKNIIITNTGKYNKKAGREEEKKKKRREGETPRGSLHSVVDIQFVGLLHFDLP